MNPSADKEILSDNSFLRLVNNPVKFNLFLLTRLPAAWFSGVRVVSVNEEACSVRVPYKWLTQNPFRSTYFASLSMAAEMSTGLLAMAAIHHRKPPVSMLVTGIEGKFYKKAIGRTIFTCKDGIMLRQAVEKAIATGEGQAITMHSMGYNKAGEMVAEFWITWSFKSKSR